MTIDWATPLAAVDAALVGASAVDAYVGGQVRARLARAGERYDVAFPTGATVLTESSEHSAWTATMLTHLTEMDEIASAADGDPPLSLGSDANDARAAVLARLQTAHAALTESDALYRPTLLAIGFQLPAEPAFYVAGYYALPFKTSFRNRGPFAGEVETEVLAAVAEATAWLALT